MTLGRLRDVRAEQLLDKLKVKAPRDRERLLKVIEETAKEDGSDQEDEVRIKRMLNLG